MFAQTHMHTYRPQRVQCYKGLLWVHAWVKRCTLTISTLLHDFVKALKKIYILKDRK